MYILKDLEIYPKKIIINLEEIYINKKSGSLPHAVECSTYLILLYANLLKISIDKFKKKKNLCCATLEMSLKGLSDVAFLFMRHLICYAENIFS